MPRLTCLALWTAYETGIRVADPDRHNLIGRRLNEAFGKLTPIAVTQEKIDAYARARQTGRIGRPAKLSTVWLELGKLKASWNYAVKRRVLASTDLPVIELPAAPMPRERWLREDEVQCVLQAATELRGEDGRLTRAERFLWLALETAARKRAVETLTWDRVDFEIGVIHYPEPGLRQTSKRRTSVPISKALLPLLRRAYSERSGLYVLDHSGSIHRPLEQVAVRSGVQFTAHTLRHTAATRMARAGVPLWLVAGVLGNSPAIVAKVYAKHSPDGLVEAVNAISPGRVPITEDIFA